MTKNPKLIIIMGLPATGKTTLSRNIVETFNLPLITRDQIKVHIMDAMGWGDREWSRKVGQASYSLMDYTMEQFVRTKTSFIIESDFNPQFANEKFNRIHQQGYDIIQIICTASEEVILERWKKRAAEDSTHPSSTEGEQGLIEVITAISGGRRKPLDVPGEVILVDTTDIAIYNDSAIIDKLKGLL